MKRILILLFAVMAAWSMTIIGCSDDSTSNNDDPATPSVASCEGCHTNYDHLKAVHSPDTVHASGGCGGDAPHYEPYDRVHLGGSGWDDFKNSSHYALGCVGCHNGVGDTDDKKMAHSGDFVAHPSTIAQEKCADCHATEVANTHNSIHQQGWGQKRKVTMRSGLNGPQEFTMLPAGVQEGYNANCATCHAATCGDCHVNRPKAGGGGLMKGHAFTQKPSMTQTCVVCHSSRGGHAFLGVAAGTEPDVHQSKMGYDCMSCHSKTDVHGDGNIYEQRYAVAGLTQCTDCHGDMESNNYHNAHSVGGFQVELSCYTCHSQDYNSCGSCHVGGQGARITSFQDFKIALNPIPDIKTGKFALVRMNPAAPDAWEKYGMDEYSNFDAFPTYNYTSPHNILRWTSRTQSSGKCFENCHIQKLDDGTFKNKNLYLFESDLRDYEKEATKSITVDGQLPEDWDVK